MTTLKRARVKRLLQRGPAVGSAFVAAAVLLGSISGVEWR